MSKVLAIVYRTISTFLIKQAGFTHKTARTDAVTLIQRFGSALNLNIHFHMLFLDGVYTDADGDTKEQRFQPVRCPSQMEMNIMKHEAAKRARMTWGERLKRVFDIDIKVCEACGGAVKII